MNVFRGNGSANIRSRRARDGLRHSEDFFLGLREADRLAGVSVSDLHVLSGNSAEHILRPDPLVVP